MKGAESCNTEAEGCENGEVTHGKGRMVLRLVLYTRRRLKATLPLMQLAGCVTATMSVKWQPPTHIFNIPGSKGA